MTIRINKWVVAAIFIMISNLSIASDMSANVDTEITVREVGKRGIITLGVSLESTVADVKRKLQEQTGHPVDIMILLFQGVRVADDTVLNTMNLGNEGAAFTLAFTEKGRVLRQIAELEQQLSQLEQQLAQLRERLATLD